jgi:hypothetical protein
VLEKFRLHGRHRTIVNESQGSGSDGSEFEDEGEVEDSDVEALIRCELWLS